MSLLPRRGPGRHDQPGEVAVHPGWTLTPTAVAEPAPPADRPTVTQVPASRWTSHPAIPPKPEPAPVVSDVAAVPAQTVTPLAVPAVPAAQLPVPMVAEPRPPTAAAPATPVQPTPAAPPVLAEPPAASRPREPEPALAPTRSWNQDWAAVAATPAPVDAPMTLHTAAVAAIDALFGTGPAAPPAWTAAPAGLQPQPHPAPLPPQVLTPVPAPTPVPAAEPVVTPPLSPLDRPLTSSDTMAETPLAAEAFRAMTPSPVVPGLPSLPPPPTPPARAVLPSAARAVVEHAMRTAPTMPPPRRSTVRLGFSDASVIDLRPDDPIARALHTVADALISRDGVRPS